MDAQILGTRSLWQQNVIWCYLTISAFPSPTKKCHFTVRFTAQSRIVCPKCRTCPGSSCHHKQYV